MLTLVKRLPVSSELLIGTVLLVAVVPLVILMNAWLGDSASLPTWLKVVSTVFIAAVTPAALWGSRPNRLKVEDPTVEDRIASVRRHLAATGQLLIELEDELRTRTELLEQRQQEADRYQHLASLNVEQAKVVEELVGRQFARQAKLTWVQWLASVMVAFVLGLIVNWISMPALNWFTSLWS